jgi:hypothetical protein
MSNRLPCAQCGGLVTSRHANKYCSPACAQAARAGPERFCQAPGCGKQLRRGQRVACSTQCAGRLGGASDGATDAQKAQVRVLWDIVPVLSVRAIGAAVKPPLRKGQVSGITNRMDLPPRASPIRGHVTGPRKVRAPAPAIRAQRSPVGPTLWLTRLARGRAIPAITPVQRDDAHSRPAAPAAVEREPRQFRPLLWTFWCDCCADKLLNCAMP